MDQKFAMHSLDAKKYTTGAGGGGGGDSYISHSYIIWAMMLTQDEI